MDKNREYFIIENHSIIKKVRIPPIQMPPGTPVQGKTSMEQSG